MKKIKIGKFKVISIILIAIITFAFSAALYTVRGSTITVDNIKWYYSISGSNAVNVYVYSYSGTLPTTLTIPETLNGYTVTSIKGKSSSTNILGASNSTITNVVIPDTVTSIATYTFSNFKALTEVTLPESLTTLGTYAFYYCTALTEVTFNENLTSIGDYAFRYCTGLSGDLTIPDSVTTIRILCILWMYRDN